VVKANWEMVDEYQEMDWRIHPPLLGWKATVMMKTYKQNTSVNSSSIDFFYIILCVYFVDYHVVENRFNIQR
jgi:hypothetical protein